jgi:hypothetical protein
VPLTVVVEAAGGGLERIADGHVHIFVRMIASGLVADHDIALGNHHVHAHSEHLSLVLMMVRPLDGDVAAGDAMMDALEARGVLADGKVDRFRHRHVSQGDLQWSLHTPEVGTGGGK